MELCGEFYPRKSKGNLFRVFLKGITQNAPFLIIFKQFYLKKTGLCFLPSAKDRLILFAGKVIKYFKTKVKAKLNVHGWAFDDTINTLCKWSLPLSSNDRVSQNRASERETQLAGCRQNNKDPKYCPMIFSKIQLVVYY